MEKYILNKPLKILILSLLNILTIILVFTIWALINIPLFPWAIISIFSPLLLINYSLLKSNRFIESFGFPSYLSFFILTTALYLFMIVFTGINYAFITPRSYIIYILIVFIFYFLVVTGLYLSGVNNRTQIENQYFERKNVLYVNDWITSIQNVLNKTARTEQSLNWINSFEHLVERLNASTPFGRIQTQSVIDQENLIVTHLSNLFEAIQKTNIQSSELFQETNIDDQINYITSLVINKEKIITNKI